MINPRFTLGSNHLLNEAASLNPVTVLGLADQLPNPGVLNTVPGMGASTPNIVSPIVGPPILNCSIPLYTIVSDFTTCLVVKSSNTFISEEVWVFMFNVFV